MRVAAIGLGGNVGDVPATFAEAFKAFTLRGIYVEAVSCLYRTPPWGGVAQADFINAVARIETAHPAETLMQILLDVERGLGRDRSTEVRWGPRTLDLDLLLMEGQVVHTDVLQLPHPRLARRAFVLVPLQEVWPHADVPGVGKVDALIHALPAQEVAEVTAGRLASHTFPTALSHRA